MELMDEILRLLRQGDKRGLELLFRQFYKPLVMYALKQLGCREEAEDVVQDVFVRLCECQRFEAIERNVRSYLYQSVYNRCMDVLEQNKGTRVELSDNALGFTDEEMPDDEDWNTRMDEIYAAVERLPERTREIFTAIVFQGKRYKDVADELGISVNTVKTLKKGAYAKLRSRLGGLTEEELMFTLLLLAALYTRV